MIRRLFETFDPLIRTARLNISVLVLITILPLIVHKYIKSVRQNEILKNTKEYMFSELGASLRNKNQYFKITTLFRIFTIILIFNLIGLIPYVYTITRQIIITLRLALPLWIAIILFNILKNTNHFLRHLVPLSTPLILSQFMTIIETVRQVIRPITLSVRLCANITAGHILIALTRSSIVMLRTVTLPLFLLLGLELAVAFIQSYVFTILTSIYLREVE